jgi:hypothetical protein
MSKNIKKFLASLVIVPLLFFGIAILIATMFAFVTWDWYSILPNIDYLYVFRVCCLIGWVFQAAIYSELI